MTPAIGGGLDTVDVAPYAEAAADAHERFAAKMWPGKRRRRESRYNRWKFRGAETGPVEGLLLAVSDGEVVGQLGLIPAVLSVDGRRLPCQWACDLMVDSSLRRQGIGSLLFNAALARGTVTLGSNASTAADLTMQRIGFRPVRGPVSAVFPLQPSHVIGWKVPARFEGLRQFLGAAVRPWFRWRGRRMLRQENSAAHVKRGEWRMVTELVAKRQAAQPEPYIVHDEAFLSWRCDGLPGFVEPLEALRTIAGGYAIVGRGAPSFYVYDWAAESWQEFIALFGAAAALAVEVGAMTIQAYAHSLAERSWLHEAGFLLLRQPCEILCHPPSRLLPQHSHMRYSIFDSDGNL